MNRVAGAIAFAAQPGHQFDVRDVEVAEELGRRAAMALENARLFRESQAAIRARGEFLSISAREIRGRATRGVVRPGPTPLP